MVILQFYKKELVLVGIRYYMPDYTSILNEFYWQTEDIVPEIPRVHQFLNYWKKNIQATIKDVEVSSSSIRTTYTGVSFFGELKQ